MKKLKKNYFDFCNFYLILLLCLVFLTVIFLPKKTQVLANSICPEISSTGAWNPYPRVNNIEKPLIQKGNCRELPMLSFLPFDTINGNPREKNVIINQQIGIRLYYNNGGSQNIQNPKAKIELIKDNSTKYRIQAFLTGDNVATANSFEKGGDLLLNIPSNSTVKIVQDTTKNYTLAGNRSFRITDNIQNGNLSNPIFSRFLDEKLPNTEGFSLGENLAAGFENYGFIDTFLEIKILAQEGNNEAPLLKSQELTINKGEDAVFKNIQVSDLDNHYPVKIDISELPNYCQLSGEKDSTGGGQNIICKTANLEIGKMEFNLIPTDQKEGTGQKTKFIINVLEPDITLEIKCTKKNSPEKCDQTSLKSDETVIYELDIVNKSEKNFDNLKILASYPANKLNNLKNLGENTMIFDSKSGKATWENLGNLETKNSKKIIVEAILTDKVVLDDKINMNFIVSSNSGNFNEKKSDYSFTIAGPLLSTSLIICEKNKFTCSDIKIYPKDILNYRFLIRNSGSSIANNVKIKATFDNTKLTKIETENNPDIKEGEIIWSIGNIESWGEKELKMQAEIVDKISKNSLILVNLEISGDNFATFNTKNNFNTDVNSVQIDWLFVVIILLGVILIFVAVAYWYSLTFLKNKQTKKPKNNDKISEKTQTEVTNYENQIDKKTTKPNYSSMYGAYNTGYRSNDKNIKSPPQKK